MARISGTTPSPVSPAWASATFWTACWKSVPVASSFSSAAALCTSSVGVIFQRASVSAKSRARV